MLDSIVPCGIIPLLPFDGNGSLHLSRKRVQTPKWQFQTNQPPPPTNMTEKQEIRLEKANEKFVLKKFGKERADCANYGWSVTDDAFCTKVYGNPTMVVVTGFDKKNKIKHICLKH